MKSGWLVVLAASLALTLAPDLSEAKRMGGGKSVGTQREAVQNKAPSGPATQASPSAAPATAAVPAAAAGTAAARKPSWAGPLAGLAAGLGLAALASHFGFGEQLASMLMMGLLAVAVMAVIGFVLRRRAQGSTGQAAPGLMPAAMQSSSDAQHAGDALRPLDAVVRTARLAAVSAILDSAWR